MILEPSFSKGNNALQILERRSEQVRRKLHTHKAARRFYTRSYLIAHDLREKSTRLLAGAGLTGMLLLSPMHLPDKDTAKPNQLIATATLSYTGILANSLQSLTPHTPTQLEPDQAKLIEDAIYRDTGLRAKAVLDGNELNHQVGFIGYEQHLQRFPSDTLVEHDAQQEAGVAPGRGAFGTFAPDRAHFTTTDYLREKYYSVAQLHLLPNWNTDYPTLKDWYKFRKILIINPVNGQAVVTALGDAGPAEWTGKQFGASPEAMKALNLHNGPRKGLVIFLFLDDPDNLVPLGPLSTPNNLNIRA